MMTLYVGIQLQISHKRQEIENVNSIKMNDDDLTTGI